MSIYAIGDLHLGLGVNKPMDIFGGKWENHIVRLENEWRKVITPNDVVLVPGDISWAMNFEEALPDFKFLESLPGRKILLRGNHDYWWRTQNKLNAFLGANNFKTIVFLRNSSFLIDKTAVCGTRGWVIPTNNGASDHDRKVYNRERERLRLSLNSIKDHVEKIIVMMHYPPFLPEDPLGGFTDILREYKVDLCVYGHLHSNSIPRDIELCYKGIAYKLVSSDAIKFRPKKL